MPSEIIEKQGLEETITTAAVCVYPNRVKDAYEAIKLMELTEKINIAAGTTFIIYIQIFNNFF